MQKIRNWIHKLRWQNMLMITLAGMINAIGVTCFLTPVHIYDSGMSGTSMLLSQITPIYLDLSLFLILLNIPLMLYGLRKLGAVFTTYAVYAVLVFAGTAWLITNVLPIDVIHGSPLAQSDLVLCALFGGVVSGVGSGLALRYGGAIDGIEVVAITVARKLGFSSGTFMMLYNIVLYVISGLVRGSWILPLYSILTYFVALKTVDFIVEGIDRSKSATIITTKPDEVCESLSAEFESGMTRIDAKGGYSNLDKTMIYFVVNRFQIARMKDIVHSIDPHAYITISEVADVFSSNQRGN